MVNRGLTKNLIEFGQIHATQLATLATHPIRITPWRMLLVEGVRHLPALEGLILDPRDPRNRLRACPGAPACPHPSTG